uniref:KIND domain-containing protein n=1 Tax=Hippocampus comes TaxID=109280 RepID=A0A3Q2ZED2_HIPCM
MRLPSKPYSSLPIYSIGSTNTVPRERISDMTSGGQAAGPVSVAFRLTKHGSLKSHEALELPSELTEDWATMEVCVDCKKFITDIIASSKHSLSLATKRARLKRKTQSLYMSSPKGREEYRPSERTISEI